jgi:CheY-like chemotaxis protein
VTQEFLKGVRILIVEDEALVAMLIEDMLVDLGCVVVGVANSVEDALKRVSAAGFDAAVVDVNVNGVESFPVAERLRSLGIPFLFSTGYGGRAIPKPLRGVPVVVKPFEHADLERGLVEMLRGYRP